jgi:hypothetical protein
VNANTARAVVAVVALILAHMRVMVAPGWVVPLPALVLAAGMALAVAGAALAVVLARGYRSATTSEAGQT